MKFVMLPPVGAEMREWASRLRADVPEFSTGDTVRVAVMVRERDKEAVIDLGRLLVERGDAPIK